MVLTQLWWGIAALVAALLAVAIAWWWPRRAQGLADLHAFAAAQRLRALPRYRTLARHRMWWLFVEVIGVAVAMSGMALLIARPVDEASAAPNRSNRDVVLCMDVSGSMQPVVQDVLGAYRQLATSLEGERLSLVMFDSAAVTVFPLTDDAAYIQTALQSASAEVQAGDVPGTKLGDVGTSLIGDGIASCLQRFDEHDPERSRTLVLATDNQTSGKSLFTVPEAAERAQQRKVLLFAITPNDNAVGPSEQLKEAANHAGGDLLALGPNTPLDDIVAALERTQARALEGPKRTNTKPLLWPGFLAVGIGATIATISVQRRAR